jgi:GTP-binding protein
MAFTIAIVGRPNVGKSTLFNRLAGKRLAIIDDTPGVTRDWREAQASLLGRPVRIIDTAGLEESFDDSIPARMRRRTEHALDRADAILFLVDGRSGLTPSDKHFAKVLRSLGKPVVLAVNKCENETVSEAGIAEAWSLGLGEPLSLSAAHGHGVEGLYHAFAPYFPEGGHNFAEEGRTEEEFHDIDEIEGREDFDFAAGGEKSDDDEQKPVKIAIAGRPNVGKSTLLNAILEDERVMTGPEAGITRDAIAVDWEYEGKKIRLVDTAGLRRKSKIEKKLERMAVEDSFRAIRLAQVVILVIDGTQPLEKQDLSIARHIVDEGRAVVLAINKWDLVDDKNRTSKELRHRLGHSFSQLKKVPLITVSAIKGRKIPELIKQVLEVYDVWNIRITTAKLNRWLEATVEANPPPLTRGKPNKIRYITQIKSRPPTFAIWVSRPQDIPNSYKRYLTNALCSAFGIEGVPVRLIVRTSKNPYV